MSTNNSAADDLQEEDFYSPMFADLRTRVVLTSVAAAQETVGMAAVLAVLAFERSAADVKRTLLNGISYSFFTFTAVHFHVANAVSLYRIWVGPLPLQVARVWCLLAHACALCNVMHHMEYVAVKFVFVVVLGRTGAFNEDFFLVFLACLNSILPAYAFALYLSADAWSVGDALYVGIMSGVHPSAIAGLNRSPVDPYDVVSTLGGITMLAALVVFGRSSVEGSRIQKLTAKISKMNVEALKKRPKKNKRRRRRLQRVGVDVVGFEQEGEGEGGVDRRGRRAKAASAKFSLPPAVPPPEVMTMWHVFAFVVMAFLMVTVPDAVLSAVPPENTVSFPASAVVATFSMFHYGNLVLFIVPGLMYYTNSKFRAFVKRKIAS